MKLSDFTYSISNTINKAIDLGKDVTSGAVVLSTDISSIGDLDTVIISVKDLKRSGKIDDNTAWNMSVILGTLLGEMIIGEHFYHWALNAENIPVVETDDKDQMSPITKIYKIICDKDSIEGDTKGFYETFQLLKGHSRQTGTVSPAMPAGMPTRREMPKQPQVASVPKPVEAYDDDFEDEELEEDDEDEFDGPDGSSETYPWEKFYPDHSDDEVVEMMISEGVRLVQGAGIKPGDLAEALLEVEKEKNRLKILKDLKQDGYKTQEKDILVFFSMEGEGKVINEMVSMFAGTFSKKVLIELYSYGTDIKLSEMLKKTTTDLNFTEEEIIDLLNSVDDSDVAGIKTLLARYNPKSIKKDTVIEICEVLPPAAMESAKKYLKLLPFEDRVEIQDDYF